MGQGSRHEMGGNVSPNPSKLAGQFRARPLGGIHRPWGRDPDRKKPAAPLTCQQGARAGGPGRRTVVPSGPAALRSSALPSPPAGLGRAPHSPRMRRTPGRRMRGECGRPARAGWASVRAREGGRKASWGIGPARPCEPASERPGDNAGPTSVRGRAQRSGPSARLYQRAAPRVGWGVGE